MGQRNSKQKKSSYNVSVGTSSAVESSNKQTVVVDKPENCEKMQNEASEAETAAAAEIAAKLIPSWVNEERFLEVMQKNVVDFERIIKFKANTAMGAGENFATLILRVGIDVELKDKSQKHLSYIMKVPHDTEQMKQMLAMMNFFPVENAAYTEVLPEMEQMYREANVDVQFGAKLYKFDSDPDCNCVLLDDLCQRGYKNAKRVDCLNKEHTESVLRKLAQFHAASATRVAIKGPYEEYFMKGLMGENVVQFMAGMIMSFREPLLSNVKHYKDGELYHDALAKHFDNFPNEMMTFFKQDPSDEFCVLNHADFWCNNILFKYDSKGTIEDVLFVDFQNPRFGTPCQDLLYFLISSTNIEIKLQHFDYFVRYYHDHLVENLKLLQYPKPMPTLRELHMKMYKYGSFAVMTSFTTMCIVLLDPTDAAKFDNFMSHTEEAIAFRKSMYSNKRYVQYMEQVLPWLYNRGFLAA